MPNLKIIFNLFYPPTDQLKKFIEDNKSNDGVYFPINGGSTLDDEWSHKFLKKDSSGDNISNLNYLLNEMTSVYWFWKNAKLPDYVGFAHYRRTFEQSDFEDYQDYDIIVSKPIWSSDKISLAQQYQHYHVLSDLQTCIDVIRDEFSYGWGEGFRKYLLSSGTNLAPCLMFIMKKELFEEWCNFIFPILFRLKEKICDAPEFQKRDNYQKRALCFLTERMFGYWYFLKRNSGFKTKELDIVEHLDYKPKNVNERGDFSKRLPRVALVALAKDEENYLKEWVDYNLKIGFTDIYIYQNRWRYDRGDINDSRVHFEVYDNERPQIPCYNMCIQKYRGMYDFVAFFDIDEFLYIKSGETVPEFLSKYIDKEAIYINWRLFGDNGLKNVKDGNYSVLERFTRCDNKLYRLGKPILNIGKTGTSIIFNNPHILVHAENPALEFRPFDPLGKMQVKYGSLDDNLLDEPCELYHYRNKTWDETVKRRLNTTDVFWPDNFKSRTDLETIRNDFEFHNRNNIQNFNLVPNKKNEDVSVVPENPTPRIKINYTAYLVGDWESVFERHVFLLKHSGLYKECEQFNIFFYPDNDRLSVLINEYGIQEKTRIFKQDSNRFEFPAMDDLMCNPLDANLYLHTKGVSLKSNKRAYVPSLYWNDYMSYFNICRYKDCLEMLKKSDMCGVELEPQKNPKNGFLYCGNFWWSTGKHLKDVHDSKKYQEFLKSDDRYFCERVMCSIPGKYAEFYNSMTNVVYSGSLYFNPILKYEFSKNNIKIKEL